MNYSYLIESARKIPVANDDSVNEYFERKEFLLTAINEHMESRSDLKTLIGENNSDMMKDNHANHVRFIYSILKNPNPEVLTEIVLWVFKSYRSHGFATTYWDVQLNAWINILKKELSEISFNQIYPLYEWMQVNIPTFVKLSGENLNTNTSRH